MSSVRKRKAMLKKLNTYFTNRGKLVGEREYSQDYTAPYRLEMIKKYLGGWTRMVYYLGFYYPRWKKPVETVTVKRVPEEAPKVKKVPKDPLETLSTSKEPENE